MIQRIDPFGLCATPETQVTSSTDTKVQGRLDLTDTSVCPVCQVRMVPILATKIPAYICWEHRVVLPQADPAVAAEDVASQGDALADSGLSKVFSSSENS